MRSGGNACLEWNCGNDVERDVRLGSLGKMLSATVSFFVVSLAALLSHLAIDELGDFWLADDAYDHVAHHSRLLAFSVVLGVSLSALAFAVRAALREARGSEGALREVLRAALPASPRRYLALVTAASLVLVTAMEALDASLAGRPAGNLAALLGGSLALGTGLVTTVAAAVTATVLGFVRRLALLHRALVEIVAAFVARRARPRYGLSSGVVWQQAATRAYSLRLPRRAAGRAPRVLSAPALKLSIPATARSNSRSQRGPATPEAGPTTKSTRPDSPPATTSISGTTSSASATSTPTSRTGCSAGACSRARRSCTRPISTCATRTGRPARRSRHICCSSPSGRRSRRRSARHERR
jgi:hypothetical protein